MTAAPAREAGLPAVRTVRLPPGAPLPPDVTEADEPVLLPGFVAHWPVVTAAGEGPESVHRYLARFDHGARVAVTVGDASLNGRIFYTDDLRGVNVSRGQAPIGEVLARIARHGAEPNPPLIYLASTTAEECLPGFRAENDVPFPNADPLASVWIGTRSRIAAHNDLPRNLACVAAGRRRFTLFPPDQTENLYPGPFEVTPAGRPISMVDLARPDLARYPRFARALETAQVAEMGPGDALFVPSMWWHHVEALGAFNLLVNYWWRPVGAHLGTPQDALTHAMLSIRDLPPQERAAWRAAFDHYVFGEAEAARAHLPEHAQGALAEMTPERARQVRAFLLNRLNR